MDWGNVTVEDLVDALQEVEWTAPPRPLNEFFSRFTVPRSYSKWNSRAKCNLYYYRTNYFIIITLVLGLAFLTNPLALFAAILAGFSLAILNDSCCNGDLCINFLRVEAFYYLYKIKMGLYSTFVIVQFVNGYWQSNCFAITFNERLTRTVRKVSPHLAAKMRPPVTPVIRGRPVKRTRAIHICGQPRWMFVLLFSSASALVWFVSCGLLTVLWALLLGLLSTLLHASFRTPNLKARLNTFREEFRAVWRNYSDL